MLPFQKLASKALLLKRNVRAARAFSSEGLTSSASRKKPSLNTGAVKRGQRSVDDPTSKRSWMGITSQKRGSQLHYRGANSQNQSIITPAQRYEMGKVIGGGRYGVVKAATDTTTGARVAIKILRKSEHVPVIRTELQTHRFMRKVIGQHPGLGIALEVFEDAKHVYIAMEYIGGGDLFDRIVSKGALSEDQAIGLLNSLVPLLQVLHSHGIIHRDIKPENILFREGSGDIDICKPIVSDFGLSRIEGEGDSVVPPAGTFGYAAPEILKNEGHDGSCDVWSLGVLMYAAIAGELPFPASMDGNTTVSGHLDEVLAGPKFDESCWTTISPAGRELIEQMLHFNSFSRPSLEVIQNHPWLQTGSLC